MSLTQEPLLTSADWTTGQPAPQSGATQPVGPTATRPAGTAATRSVDTAAAVEAHDVRKSYGAKDVLRGISLTIGAGEVFGLLGPNGAGKTTLVECLVGLRRPDVGSINVLGMKPLERRHEFTSRVSVQPQDANLFENIRAREALDLFASMYRAPLSTDDVIDQIGLADSSDQLVRKLSGGQRRRLLLGVAMIGSPELIVLDEPSAGLDPQARRGLWSVVERLRSTGTTVLLTTHHMDEAAALCDRVAFIVEGQVAALGTPNELVHQLSAGQQVSFDLDGADPEAVTAELEALPGVTDVRITRPPGNVPAHLTVSTQDSDAVVAHIAQATSWRARAISIDQGDLENVFLAVTQANAGDTAAETPAAARRSRRDRSAGKDTRS